MEPYRILIVDDEVGMRDSCAETLRSLAVAEVEVAGTAAEAVARLAEDRLDLLVAGAAICAGEGAAFLHRVRGLDPELPILVTGATPALVSGLAASRDGRVDTFPGPFCPERLRERVRRIFEELRLREENRLLHRQLERGPEDGEIVSESRAMTRVVEAIERAARGEVDVLVEGEPGSGRRGVARAIHRASARASGRFVVASRGDLPAAAFEEELFGGSPGPTEGGDPPGTGLLEAADGGTLYLEAITEIPVSLQAKILAAAEEGRIRRGAGKAIPVNLRIVASTDRDVDRRVREKRFLRGLLARFARARIRVPPLRARLEDIRPLAERLVARARPESGRTVEGFSDEAIEVLEGYPWPGNVRELRDVVRHCVSAARGTRIEVEDLPEGVVLGAACASEGKRDGFYRLREAHLRRFERGYFDGLLARHRGDVRSAAAEARVPRATLLRLLKQLGIRPAAYRR